MDFRVICYIFGIRSAVTPPPSDPETAIVLIHPPFHRGESETLLRLLACIQTIYGGMESAESGNMKQRTALRQKMGIFIPEYSFKVHCFRMNFLHSQMADGWLVGLIIMSWVR